MPVTNQKGQTRMFVPTNSAVRDFGSVVFSQKTIGPFRICRTGIPACPSPKEDRRECLSYLNEIDPSPVCGRNWSRSGIV